MGLLILRSPRRVPGGFRRLRSTALSQASNSWRVNVVAADNSAQALRDAKTLALEVEAEIFADVAERHKQRRPADRSAAGIQNAV